MNNKINELKIKINQLGQQIKDATESRDKAFDTEEKIRKTLVTNICISGVGYLILGPLIHPAIGLASLLFLGFNVIPGGIAVLHLENKGEKFDKEISRCKMETIASEKELDELLKAETIAQLPTENKTNKKDTTPVITQNKNNVAQKTR